MKTVILWFRRDLRLTDNPALVAALEAAESVLPVYIHEPDDSDWALGAASRWWLHHSLKSLDTALARQGSRLIIRTGDPATVLTELIDRTDANGVYWNRLYEPAAIQRDTEIKQRLRAMGITVNSYNSTLLNEPWAIQTATGSCYKVYTPYSKAVLKLGLSDPILPAPSAMPKVDGKIQGQTPEELNLLPRISWDSGFYRSWSVGEDAAMERLQTFLAAPIVGYDSQRDRPDHMGTSRLSPHLSFGEISPRQIIAAVQQHRMNHSSAVSEKGTQVFIQEVLWREFAYHLLYHYPQTVEQAMAAKFARFEWASDYTENLKAWQSGTTGIPLVDAGLRELWATGWMHNRVRMVVASFLTKNLLIPWQEGARWFWDTLVDADLASNTLGWQWVAGCGADAAPYFRIFNPVLQAERFDPEGTYTRRWIPELATLPNTCLHQPWTASSSILAASRVRLGTDYPLPLVDLKISRERALLAYKAIK